MLLIIVLFICQFANAKNSSNSWCELGKIGGGICCEKSCDDNCGECLENSTIINRFINSLCCPENIRNISDLCNFTLPPCILFNNGTHIKDSSMWEMWVIIAMVIGGCMIVLLVFVCIFYPVERQPPLEYKYIVKKLN
jgi:hypothetical protein